MKVRLLEFVFVISVASTIIRIFASWQYSDAPLSTIQDALPVILKTNDFEFIEFLPNTVLLTLTNTGYLLLTKNLIMSLERIGLGKYLMIASFESKASKSLLEMREFTGKVHKFANNKPTPMAMFETSQFKENAGRRKLIAIRHYLQMGHNVFYVDSDVAVLLDFRKAFSVEDLDTYDAILQDGRGSDLPTPNWFEPCTGFMYLRASPTTLNCTDIEKHKRLWNRTRDDQSYLVREFLPYWKIKQLPKAQFVTGWWMNNVIKTSSHLHRLRCSRGVNSTLYVVHMNYMRGGVTKLRHHWKFGTLYYEGPGVSELLDLEHWEEEKLKNQRIF